MARSDDEGFGDLPPGLRRVDVMNLSLDAAQELLTRYRIAGYPPHLLIELPADACGTLEFYRATEMIELGRTVALEALDRAWPRRF
jgi:NTE family protein